MDAKLLTRLMNSSGIRNQKHLAEKLGVTRAAVNNWFLGKNRPAGETFYLIADLLNVEVDTILEIFYNTAYLQEKIKKVKESKRKCLTR